MRQDLRDIGEEEKTELSQGALVEELERMPYNIRIFVKPRNRVAVSPEQLLRVSFIKWSM